MSFRIGLIGAGIHGTRYLRHAARDVPGMTVGALCRRDDEAGRKLAAELACSYHADPLALIEDPQVDGVVICTPPSTHFELAIAALEAGKPILLEKPMTGTLQQATDLKTRAAQAPHPIFVAQTLRWNPVIRAFKENWSRLGKVHLVRMAQRLQPTTLAWQRDAELTVGGSVLLTGVHLFDTVRYLTDSEFTHIDSQQKQILNPVVEDFFLARATLADGCTASLEVSKYTRSRACWLEAVGEDAQMWADYQSGGIVFRCGADEERIDVAANEPTLPLVLRSWLESVESATPPPVGVADGLATLQVVDACYRSSKSGQPEVIGRRIP